MKICFIELMPFPYTVGGGTTHLMNLGKTLAEMGHEVHIISSRPGEDYERIKDYPKSIKLHNVGMRHKKFEGGISYYFYRLVFESSFVFAAWKELGKINPDIVDCQSAITTALPASLSGYPFVITCHGVHSLGFEKLYNSKGKKFVAKTLIKIYSMMERYNVRKARKIISQGKETLDYYGKLAGDKSKELLVPNLVDVDFWKYAPKKDEKLIVNVARLTKQKSQDKLIQAMKELKDFRLLVAGDGELKDYLGSIAGNNTKLLGYQSPEQCRELYKKARFVVLPSEFEGLPYAILEAMSCGVIPITTKVGDLRELIKEGENGFFLDNNKPSTITKKIREAKKFNLKKIAERARETILNRYSTKVVASIFLDNYKRLTRVGQ